jgi:hypothetical protein
LCADHTAAAAQQQPHAAVVMSCRQSPVLTSNVLNIRVTSEIVAILSFLHVAGAMTGMQLQNLILIVMVLSDSGGLNRNGTN